MLGDRPRAKFGVLAPKKISFVDLLVSFLFPTLIGKSLLLYFGLNYSEHPGEGYGYGLVFAFTLTLCMVGRFLWKYRNYDDT